MSRVPTAPPTADGAASSLALTRHPHRPDRRPGVGAGASEENLDSTPSRYYRDSPVLIKDKVVEGYAKTTSTPVGQRADPYYMERIGVASVISEATSLYNAERYQDALGQYKTALATPQGAAAARRERRLPHQHQARPHRRGRAGVRPDRRPRHRLQRARREVPVRAGQRRLLVRPEDQRRLRHVAAPDRARARSRAGSCMSDRRPHQQERAGGRSTTRCR